MTATIVVGDIMMDIFLLPALQAAEQVNGLLLRTGGSAANTAAWLAYLGSSVTLVGSVGNDPAGLTVMEELRRHGVATRISAQAERPTGAVLVALDTDREYVLRSSRGANVLLSADDINSVHRDLSLTHVHLSAYALLSAPGFKLLEAAAQLARAGGAQLSIDVSSQNAISNLGPDLLFQALVHAETSILFANASEVRALTGHDSGVEAVKQLAASFPLVFIKHGANGAQWAHGDRTGLLPALGVPVVDTTGAGDAFAAGALSALQRNSDAEDACRAGNIAAGRAVQMYGGMPPDID